MKGADLCDLLRSQINVKTDTAVANALGLTPGRVSQIRKSKKPLTAKQIAKFIEKTLVHKVGDEFTNAVNPVVEFFEVTPTPTSHKVKLIPFDYNKNPDLKKTLEEKKGVYAFYNSEGDIIYLGKTKGQTLFAELKNAFNRTFPSYQILTVKHPWKKFKVSDAGEKQIKKKNAYLHETAKYFSCYGVKDELIGPLEALLIRVMPNNLMNVRMEKLKSKSQKRD